jgi:hypothetical protein
MTPLLDEYEYVEVGTADRRIGSDGTSEGSSHQPIYDRMFVWCADDKEVLARGTVERLTASSNADVPRDASGLLERSGPRIDRVG